MVLDFTLYLNTLIYRVCEDCDAELHLFLYGDHDSLTDAYDLLSFLIIEEVLSYTIQASVTL